jgi:hypothetical protein
MSETTIQVKRKPFDPGFYKWRIRIVIRENRRTADEKVGIIQNLVTRAYEQGVMDGKNDQDYYKDY